MKKILKITFSVVLAFVCVFSFTACKKKISATTVDVSKTIVNGVQSNGGVTAVYGDYLYFFNGVRTNDGTTLEDVTRSAIYRVKYNAADGSIDETTYEVVVDNLAGYEKGSLYFFGDYMYYATPCTDKNNKATVLYNKTNFMRYDLVNNKSYKLYTTQQNDEKESISYAYYVVGEELHLVVYETNNATITSLKINKDVKTNYVISNVASCVLSENYGTCVTKNAPIDANNFVFYTTAHGEVKEDAVQTGNKVFRTSPVSNNPELICDNGSTISILSIRNGKLIYTCDSTVYAETISGAANEKLYMGHSTTIAYNYSADASYLFIENSDGTISVLYYDSKAYNLNIVTWKNESLEPVTIQEFTKDDKFEFLTTTTITETEEVEGSETPETHEVTYLIYINSTKLYKIEIAYDGNYSDSVFADAIQLTSTAVASASGNLVPEVIGDYLYIFAENSDKNKYLYRVDITIDDLSDYEKDDDKKAKFIGVLDDTDTKSTETK